MQMDNNICFVLLSYVSVGKNVHVVKTERRVSKE